MQLICLVLKSSKPSQIFFFLCVIRSYYLGLDSLGTPYGGTFVRITRIEFLASCIYFVAMFMHELK